MTRFIRLFLGHKMLAAASASRNALPSSIIASGSGSVAPTSSVSILTAGQSRFVMSNSIRAVTNTSLVGAYPVICLRLHLPLPLV